MEELWGMAGFGLFKAFLAGKPQKKCGIFKRIASEITKEIANKKTLALLWCRWHNSQQFKNSCTLIFCRLTTLVRVILGTFRLEKFYQEAVKTLRRQTTM